MNVSAHHHSSGCDDAHDDRPHFVGLVAYLVLPIAGVPQVDIPTIR